MVKKTAVAVVAGIVVCGGTAALAGPVILPLIGFTSSGITAGSAAASFMSVVYTKGVGMAALSAMQSAGALGTVGTTGIAASSAAGGAVGSALSALSKRVKWRR